MKIILALFGFFVAACCIPAPQTQNCSGSQCKQSNLNAKTAVQNCQTSQCDQSNLGLDGAKPDWLKNIETLNFGTSNFKGFDVFNQNCKGAQCVQQNSGRKKRETVQRVKRSSPTETYTCEGGMVSSKCAGSSCEIICSDNTRYQHDCGKEGSQVSTSGNVVTVTCGGEPVTYSPCFPFCSNSDSGSSSGSGSGTNSDSGIIQPPPQDNFPSGDPDQQPPATEDVVGPSVTALKTCIDSCPVNNSYRGCVTECLRNRK